MSETQGALDAMVAGIMESKVAAAIPLRQLPQERVNSAVTQAVTQIDMTLDEMRVRQVEEQLVVIRSALATIEHVLGNAKRHKPGVDAIDEARAGLDMTWKCPTHGKAFDKADELDHIRAFCPECDERQPEPAVAAPEPSPVPPTPGVDKVATQGDSTAQRPSGPAEQPVTPNHWVCPEHGVGEERTSKKGRKYHACTECSEFEKLA